MMEGLKFLPPILYAALSKLDYNKLYEVRIRADKPVKICYDGKFVSLSPSGVFGKESVSSRESLGVKCGSTQGGWEKQSCAGFGTFGRKNLSPHEPFVEKNSLAHANPGVKGISAYSNSSKNLAPNEVGVFGASPLMKKEESSAYGNSSKNLSPNEVGVLGANPLMKNEGAETIALSAAQITEIVLRAAEFSIYAFNSQLAGGYITIRGGIRIGVAGEVVYEGERVKTQKNFGSLVIRIPHEIKGSADIAYRTLMSSSNKNMLLISPPGCGKTTILRDITRRISDTGANVLLVDERSEIAACRCGVATLDVGQNTDVISCAGKNYAFTFGIRSLRPDYIVTDELMNVSDIEAVRRAALSGVNVIASLHAGGIDDIKNRPELASILTNRVFGRYVLLSQKNGAGTYDNILDESLHPFAF